MWLMRLKKDMNFIDFIFVNHNLSNYNFSHDASSLIVVVHICCFHVAIINIRTLSFENYVLVMLSLSIALIMCDCS